MSSVACSNFLYFAWKVVDFVQLANYACLVVRRLQGFEEDGWQKQHNFNLLTGIIFQNCRNILNFSIKDNDEKLWRAHPDTKRSPGAFRSHWSGDNCTNGKDIDYYCCMWQAGQKWAEFRWKCLLMAHNFIYLSRSFVCSKRYGGENLILQYLPRILFARILTEEILWSKGQLP